MSSNINEVQTNTANPAQVKSDEPVSVEVTVNGEPINPTYQIQLVDVSLVADALVVASFNILDGGPDGFVVSGDPALLPGNTVEISLGYSGDVVKVFTGVIVAQSLNINNVQAGILSITCESPSVIAADKTKGEPVLTFTYGTDIISLSTHLKRAVDNSLSVRGDINFQGNSAAVPGNHIQIEGIANNIKGMHNVVRVHHVLSNGNWVTSITFGGD